MNVVNIVNTSPSLRYQVAGCIHLIEGNSCELLSESSTRSVERTGIESGCTIAVAKPAHSNELGS